MSGVKKTLLLCVVWWVVFLLGWYMLPQRQYLWPHLSFTMQTIGWAFMGAFGLALPLAWFMSKSRWLRTSMQSFLLLFQSMPMFALAPLMVLCFGWSHAAVIVPTFLMLLFPLLINSLKGFASVPEEYVWLFRVHGARYWQIFLRLHVPYALPHIFAGLRVAVSICGAGAIAGEWAGAQRGLGVFLQECRRDVDIAGIGLGLCILLGITVGLYLWISVVEKLLTKGRPYASL